MSMIKIEVPNSDIEALDLAGEFFIKLAQSRRSFIASAQEHVHVSEPEIEEIEEVEEVVTPEQIAEVEEEEVVVTEPVVEAEEVPMPPILPPPPVAVAEIESKDLPYDERIHSSGKTRNQDGTWKLRRRPAEMEEEEWKDYIEQVENELRELASIKPTESVANEEFQDLTFEDLMMKLAVHAGTPGFMDHATQIAKEVGLSQISELKQAPQLIPDFLRLLDLEGKGVTE